MTLPLESRPVLEMVPWMLLPPGAQLLALPSHTLQRTYLSSGSLVPVTTAVMS